MLDDRNGVERHRPQAKERAGDVEKRHEEEHAPPFQEDGEEHPREAMGEGSR